MDAGGWQAMKHARALLEMARVISFNYTPPILKGLVREGTAEYRAGLKIRSRNDIETLCSCRESREWGKICPHSLALGLAYLQPRESVVIKSTAPASITPQGPRLIVDEDQPAITAFFILPPTFVSGWDRGQIMEQNVHLFLCGPANIGKDARVQPGRLVRDGNAKPGTVLPMS